MTEPTKNNTPKMLMEFFSIPDRPVSASEFRVFWQSLSEAEKEYYKTVPLS